jgi:hypothetical protein
VVARAIAVNEMEAFRAEETGSGQVGSLIVESRAMVRTCG